MDEGLLVIYLALVLILVLIPLALRGTRWALMSFIGVLFAVYAAQQLGSDGSIIVGYAVNGAVVTPITQSPALAYLAFALLAMLGLIVTVAKLLDKI